MRIEAASAQLEALETEAALDRPENLRGRLAALQTVANLADLIAWRPAAEGWPALEARTAQQRARFERANARYYAGLRLQIRRGRYTRDALRQILDGYTSYVPGHTHHLLTGPDQLDLLLDGLLDLPPIPVGRATAPAPEASPYEPAPARAALQMCDLCNQASLAPGERFYDIGAGAGRMWMEESEGSRINETRVNEALAVKPQTICTACPYCMTMFEDGLKDVHAENVVVKDVAEVVAAAVLSPQAH